MKESLIGLSISLIVLLVSAVFVEAGYRVYLSMSLKQQVADRQQMAEGRGTDPVTERFHVYAAPGPWRYSADYGFEFTPGPWLRATFADGKFALCDASGGGNRFGNSGLNDPQYEAAEVKVHVYGSSFTMGTIEKKMPFATALEDALSQSFDKTVSVLNFSRDSVGLITNFDTAGIKVPELQPDLVLFLFNVTAFGYPRHWRALEAVDDTVSRLTFYLDRPGSGTNLRTIASRRLVSKTVNEGWCARMAAGPNRTDQETADALLKHHSAIASEPDRQMRPIDFFDPSRSFVFNRLFRGNALAGLELYVTNAITIDDFRQDDGFVRSLEVLKLEGVPIVMMLIPTLPAMRIDPKGGYHFEKHGVTEERGRALFRSLEDLTGQKVLSAYDWYPPAARADPLALVQSEEDSHPSDEGNRVLIAAIVEALKDLPETRRFSQQAGE